MITDNTSVEKVKWGKTVVRLDNRNGVDKPLLKQLIMKFNLPCRLLLILDTENGFSPNIAASFPRVDMNFAAPRGPNEDNRKRIGEHNIKAWRQWDYAVYIPEKTAKKAIKFEPYFAFVIGHELEHVKIMQHDLKLHRFAAWIYDNFEKFTKSVGGEFTIRNYQFPWQLHCNKVGKNFAENMHKDFANTLRNLMPTVSEDCQEVLQFVLSPECDLKDDDLIESIADKILFRIGEMRNSICRFWKTEREKKDNYAKVVDLPAFLNCESYYAHS